jgi:iron complex transport system substrate-binding protein
MILITRIVLLLLLILLPGRTPCAGAREIIDMAGRKVSVPDTIQKAYGTSPPATYMIYAMDPGLVAGFNFPFNPSEGRYLDPRMGQLPVVGGWFGQGRVANLETLLKVKPDIIVMWKWRNSASGEKSEQVLKPLNIPVIYIVLDSLDDYPAAFGFLGKLFNLNERAETLSRYAERSLERAEQMHAKIPASYYAEGPDGLSTECHSSMHAELIPLSGGRNVHQCSDHSTFGMQKISMEQVLQYNPQVIVAHEPLFFSQLSMNPKWKNISAVKTGRIYRIPRTPFNWFDRPPSFMRLLGLQWMICQLYPKACALDLTAETRRFYQLFLNVNLDGDATRKLLQP